MSRPDVYLEALACLRLILQADHPEFQNWIAWLGRDMEDWERRGEIAHHLRAYGGMGSFNDLPPMHGSHDYIFNFLKSVCYTFAHLYGERENVPIKALMEECVRDAVKAPYHPQKALNRAIARRLTRGDLRDNP